MIQNPPWSSSPFMFLDILLYSLDNIFPTTINAKTIAQKNNLFSLQIKPIWSFVLVLIKLKVEMG